MYLQAACVTVIISAKYDQLFFPDGIIIKFISCRSVIEQPFLRYVDIAPGMIVTVSAEISNVLHYVY